MKAFEIDCQYRSRKEDIEIKEREALQKERYKKFQGEVATHNESE